MAIRKRSFFYVLLVLPFCCFHSLAYSQDKTLSKKDTAEIRFINQRKFFIYKVDKGETLYSIAGKFKIPLEEVKEFNPELRDGLKVKMKLWIPAYSNAKKEQQVTASKDKHPEDKPYNIAIITALNIPQNFSMDASLVDSNFVSSLGEETIANLEFYEGILIALDSLRKNKLKAHIHLFDDENDSTKTATLLKNPEMKKMDLIISNGNGAITIEINAFSKMNHIPFTSFTMHAADLIKDNKNAIALYPSSLTQCMEMGKIASEKFKLANCIVLKTFINKENERSLAFKKGWLDVSDKKVKEVAFSLVNKKVTNDSMQDYLKAIKDSLLTKQDNLIFIPSSNEEFVSTLINALKDYSEQYRITLIGLPTWQHFETIDPLLFELLDVHIFTSSFIEYSSAASINFRKKFRDTYNIEPADAAFQGFDLMMMAGIELIEHGKKFEDHLTEKIFNGIFSSYRFTKVPENPYLENHYIAVCKYRNYVLTKIND